MTKSILYLLLIVMMIENVRANEHFHYPELMVAPKASERLLIEAKKEKNTQYLKFLPIQLSSLMTLLTAMELKGAALKGNLSASEREEEESKQSLLSMLGMGVGLGWLAITTYATVGSRPYYDAFIENKKLSTKNLEDNLVKERLAEEQLKSFARISRLSRYLSTATNATSCFLMGNVQVDSDKSNTMIYSNLCLLTSFLPLLFETHYERVYEEQEKYKKRIYGPLSWNVTPWISTSRIETRNASEKHSPLWGLRLTMNF